MKNKLLKSIILIIFLVFFDLITKSLFYKNINQGTIYGIFRNNTIWIIFSIVVLIILIILIKKNKKYSFAILFIVSGIIGNLYDRLFYNGVRDFINFFDILVFNLADIYINIGIFFILYIILFKK